MEQLPPFAAWRFLGAVEGFEVVYTAPGELRGHTSAIEAGQAYAVRYDIRFDEQWRTREVNISTDTVVGPQEVRLAADGSGNWTVNDQPRLDLHGLMDVDLEASACTNTFPVHRLHLPTGETVRAPAVYVQALDLTVRRLDQAYRRLDADRFHYTSEGGFEAVLRYDDSLLIIDYPGIAVRFA
ncbi:putative glycolipid-binding domain-containing protein [Nocardioides sp. cx-169]|uniref:putative glycolipid-binding domain-containing protein n=1 Tax=Nocardioides sp. cx-169 TaxID=2899080 RepID=UPI001E40B79D|nr:putative glycolipid-binding domain-containing protein [Nocardioides sp. cx-169]MCD4535475.1 putative glycolipid-binding domain-containing protein [Nocardioides sp. cx-169]